MIVQFVGGLDVGIELGSDTIVRSGPVGAAGLDAWVAVREL
jgi:hypothetical protein